MSNQPRAYVLRPPGGFFCLLSCLLAATVAVVSPADAAVIEPLRLELVAAAGSPIQGEFHVQNTYGYPIVVSARAGEYPMVLFSEVSTPSEIPSCVTWIRLSPEELTLAPGERRPIRYQLVVPEGVAEEYFAAVHFDIDQAVGGAQPEAPGQGRLQLTMRFTVPVYVGISGYEQPKVSFPEIHIDQFPQDQRIRFGLQLINEGAIHVRPFGHVMITDDQRRLVARIPVGQALPLLPGQRGEIPVFWQPTVNGRLTIVAVVNIGKQILENYTSFQFDGW